MLSIPVPPILPPISALEGINIEEIQQINPPTATSISIYHTRSSLSHNAAMNMGSGELPQADTVWRSIDPFQLPQQPSMMAQLNSKPSNRIEKKHKCNICGGFFDYNSLRTHLYSHKGGQHELRGMFDLDKPGRFAFHCVTNQSYSFRFC